MRTISLLAHPVHPLSEVRDITVFLQQDGANLQLHYLLQGQIDRLRLPPPATPVRRDGLWQTTCFELFIRTGETSYEEYNFAPSGEWAHYRFADIRKRIEDDTDTAQPDILVERTDTRLQLQVSVPLPAGAIALGLCAVVDTIDGGLGYWALHHPATQPDFHHFDAFALRLA